MNIKSIDMDKEVANHKTFGAPIDFRLSKSELPGQEGVLKASVSQRETVGIE